jgi:hypothetical protein
MAARSESERMAQGLEDLAKAFDGSGLGQHPISGHSALLKRMAQSVRADMAVGKTPYSYSDSAAMYAAADTGASFPPMVRHALDKAGLAQLQAAGETISLESLDATFAEMETPSSDRFLLKGFLATAQKISAS